MMSERKFNQKGFFISAVFLLVVFALGLGALGMRLLFPASPDTTASTQPSVAAEETEGAKTTDSKPSDSNAPVGDPNCSFSDLELDKIPDSGFVTDWKAWGERIKLPYSSHGAKIYDGIPHCFAPSLEGAVLAAGNYAVLALSGERELEVSEQYLYPNDFSKVALKEVRSRVERLQPVIELKGWHIEGIGDNHVLVYVAFTRPDAPNKLISWGMEMQYHGGDWKFVGKENLQATFSEIFSVEQSGYKRW